MSPETKHALQHNNPSLCVCKHNEAVAEGDFELHTSARKPWTLCMLCLGDRRSPRGKMMMDWRFSESSQPPSLIKPVNN